MKSINLGSLIDVLKSDDEDLIKSYSLINDFDLKNHERTSFLSFAEKLKKLCYDYQLLGYFVGKKTRSGISEEFDLLRFSNRYVINIEIKSTWPKKEMQCLDQLTSHEGILRILKKEVHCYVYIEDEDVLYTLQDGELITSDFQNLITYLERDYSDANCLDKVNLSSMLISPYTDPERFTKKEYILTQQQSEFKRNILSKTGKYTIICGNAGTGKSLLLFDIAHCYSYKGKKPCVIVCRNCSNKNYLSNVLKLDIIEIKDLTSLLESERINDYDVILIDEAQRLRDNQLNSILKLSLDKWHVIFSIDPLQTLNLQESNSNVFERIKNNDSSQIYKLSNRIRSNESIEMFTRRMVCLNCTDYEKKNYDCIHLTYFSDEESCVDYLQQLYRQKKKVIEPTPYTTKTTRTELRRKRFISSSDPHAVLSEEYDDVVVLLDEYFMYQRIDNKILLKSSFQGYYPYDINHCIYVAITRAKKTLEIVILNNKELFESVSKILSN